MATYYCVDRLPLDCHSPCQDNVLPRGWRGERDQGLPQCKTSLQAGSQPYLKQPTYLMYAFAIVLMCIQTSAIIFLSFKYSQMETEMAQHRAVIRRLEDEVGFPRSRNDGARDPKKYDTPQVDGLPREVDHHDGYLSYIRARDGIIGEQSWSSRRLLGNRKRRNTGGRCKCNSRIASLQRTMNEAIARIPEIVQDSVSRGGPGIHLQGRDGSNIIHGPGTHFRWEEPNPFNSGGFRLIANSKIEVLEAGFYFVYSQIAVNGRRYRSGSSSFNPSCGHETVKLQGEHPTVLLTSVLTQDSRGHHYAYSNASNLIYPLDTLSHMGVFYLSANDRLVVRTTEYSHSDRYMVDQRYSYFGVVKIS